MPPIPPMPPIEPMEGIAPPPEDIMVEEEEDEEVDLKLEMVLPSSDCVVAAMLWLLAFSSFVTKASDCAFIASLTSAPSGAWICLGADTVRMPAPEYVDASCSVTTPAGILNSLVNFLELLDPSSFFDSCTASTMMMSSLVFKAKSSGAKPGSSSWIWNLSLLADTWMLWAASPRPAPATPIARALNSANLLSRPAPMLSFRSAKKGSEKKADLFESSSCFSDILRLSCLSRLHKEGHKTLRLCWLFMEGFSSRCSRLPACGLTPM